MKKQEMLALIKRIDKGNPKPEDLEALRQEMSDRPGLSRLGNTQKLVMDQVLAAFTNESISSQEFIKKYVKEMKTELGYSNSTFVEKMLIDEIVMRWLRLSEMESGHLKITSQNHAVEVGMYMDRRLDIAQKRFLRAMTTLAKVRKMIGQTQAAGAKMFKDLMTKE